MKKDNKKIIIIISSLLVIIVLLIIILFLPKKEDDNYKISDDFIDVNANLIDEENGISIDRMNKRLDNEEIRIKDKERLEEIRSSEETDIVREYDSEGNLLDTPEKIKEYADSQAIDREADTSNPFNGYGITFEEFKLQQEEGWMESFNINYYQEDALSIAKDAVSPIYNLSITPQSKTPLIEAHNPYGEFVLMWVFEVRNNETKELDDGIVVNLETGDCYGYTKDFGIIIPFRRYKYSPQYIIDEREYSSENRHNINIESYDTMIEIVETVVDTSKYPTKDLKVVIIDNLEYFKWTNTVNDGYVLLDYETLEVVENTVD